MRTLIFVLLAVSFGSFVLSLAGCGAGIQTPIGGSSVNVLPGYLPPPPPPNYLR